MKLVIEIPDEVYSHAKDIENRLLTPNEESVLRDSMINGTPLPRNATNGDIFKAMFSNLTIYENRDNKDYPYVDVIIGEHDSTCYPKDWWDEQK